MKKETQEMYEEKEELKESEKEYIEESEYGAKAVGSCFFPQTAGS